jgi:acetyl coenzyme A synthetase (ADP forming)-like protein
MLKTMLSEADGYDLLGKYGITVPEHRIVESKDEAIKAANEIGFPVVMKIVSPQVIHKSDVGGVIIGIRTEHEVEKAFNEITSGVKEKYPKAEIRGIIVEKQLHSGLELIIGGKSDPSFGKVISFGLGGKLVELLKDIVLRVLPIDTNEIRRMIKEIKAYSLIKGYRDEPPKDEEDLVTIIGAISKLFYENSNLFEFDINPLILYEKGACAVDARFIVSEELSNTKEAKGESESSPEATFNPDSIAVVGASSNPNKVGYAVLRNLLFFPGRVYPVNPNRKEILGLSVYPSIASIPDKVDLVVVTVPGEMVPDIIDEAGKKDIKLAVVISAGFRETGEKGKILEDKIIEIAQKYNLRIVGPNCLGIMLPHKKINATFDPISPRPGHIAFISQSGAIITTVVDWSIPEEVGFSAVISVGNQVDFGFVDFLKFAERDEETKAIILYIEEIKNGKEFMKIVEKVSEKKPIVAIKAGSSEKGQKAASSHTGSLAGSYEVYMAAFKQSGIITSHSLKEAFQVGELLASEGYPKGNRAIVISNAGGFAVLASDYAKEHSTELIELSENVLDELNSQLPEDWSHENPIDLMGDAGTDRYAYVFDVMTRHQDKWDIAFVISVPTAVLDPNHLAKEIVRFSKNTHKMITGCMLGGESVKSGVRILRHANIPNFSELEDAFKIVGKTLNTNSG